MLGEQNTRQSFTLLGLGGNTPPAFYCFQQIDYSNQLPFIFIIFIQVGATILELSKMHMTDKFYNFIAKEFSSVRLSMTDTDSFLLSSDVTNETIEQLLERNHHHFDFSNLPKNHKLHNMQHKNELNRYAVQN